MKKTASQLANYVLEKCAFGEDYVPTTPEQDAEAYGWIDQMYRDRRDGREVDWNTMPDVMDGIKHPYIDWWDRHSYEISSGARPAPYADADVNIAAVEPGNDSV